MNGVVRGLCRGDQKVRIENPVFSVNDVAWLHRIDVVYKQFVVNLKPGKPEIASVVSNDHLFSDLFPFTGCVEVLIEVSVESERFGAYLAA